MTFGRRLAALGALLLAAVPAQALAQWRAGSATVTPYASVRMRNEDWSWFQADAPARSAYGFGNVVARAGARVDRRRLQVVGELAMPMLLDLETNVVAPMPKGPVAIGGYYRAASGTETRALFVKQAFAGLRVGPGDRGGMVRAGRVAWHEGRERVIADSAFTQLKSERVAERLIGGFAFTVTGRSFDGLVAELPVGSAQVSAVAVRPTEGVFQLNGAGRLPVDLAYGAVTLPLARPRADGTPGVLAEVRGFGIHFKDRRGLAITDNRMIAGQAADSGAVTIGTIGGHVLAMVPAGRSRVDLMGWGAVQRGSVGRHAASGWAAAVEGGVQWREAPARPWLRAGWFRSSGDPDPTDGRNQTFQGLMPSPRIYARVPFFNLMNVDDRFLQLIAEPSRRVRMRGDLHLLQLADGNDLWYAGGGAYSMRAYGTMGRAVGGRRSLGRLVDLGADVRLTPETSLGAYAGFVSGGEAIAHVHPSGADARFLFVEMTRRF